MVEFKESIWRKLRRKSLGLILSKDRQMLKLAEIIEQIYTLTESVEGTYISTWGQRLLVHDNNVKENVFLIMTVEPLGKQAAMIVNEGGDYVGIGRMVKNLLESQNYQVYYQVDPIAYIDGYLVVGSNYINAMRAKGQPKITVTKGNANETVH